MLQNVTNNVEEMAYPNVFNWDEFKSLRSFSARIKYCENHGLERISQGSGRVAYRVDNEKCLKLAKNQKGVAQNFEEMRSYATEVGIGANIFEADYDNGLWLEMEIARKCTAADWKRLLGVSFKFVCELIDYIRGQYSVRRYGRRVIWGAQYDDFMEKVYNYDIQGSEWFKGLYDYLTNTGLESVDDLQRPGSWGVVSRNGSEEIALIDMGLTDEVQRQYYSLRENEFKYLVKECIKYIYKKRGV